MKFLKLSYKLKILPEEEESFEFVVFPLVRRVQSQTFAKEMIEDIANFKNIDAEAELIELLQEELLVILNAPTSSNGCSEPAVGLNENQFFS